MAAPLCGSNLSHHVCEFPFAPCLFFEVHWIFILDPHFIEQSLLDSRIISHGSNHNFNSSAGGSWLLKKIQEFINASYFIPQKMSDFVEVRHHQAPGHFLRFIG
jgi:hypothetical protein